MQIRILYCSDQYTHHVVLKHVYPARVVIDAALLSPNSIL